MGKIVAPRPARIQVGRAGAEMACGFANPERDSGVLEAPIGIEELRPNRADLRPSCRQA